MAQLKEEEKIKIALVFTGGVEKVDAFHQDLVREILSEKKNDPQSFRVNERFLEVQFTSHPKFRGEIKTAKLEPTSVCILFGSPKFLTSDGKKIREALKNDGFDFHLSFVRKGGEEEIFYDYDEEGEEDKLYHRIEDVIDFLWKIFEPEQREWRVKCRKKMNNE